MAKAPAPPLRFLFRHPAHLVACGFGSGLAPIVPGTFGTLFGWLTFPLLRAYFPGDIWLACFIALAFVFGITACHVTGRALGVVDHGSIVWDEIVPFWAVLLLTPPTLMWQFAAFVWFRVYDIFKPPPANYFDDQVKNGFGVMMDDVVAAGYTVLTLAVIKVLVERLY